MRTTSDTKHHFNRPLVQTWWKTARGLGRAAYTVFTTPAVPNHDESIYLTVAARLRSTTIALVPPMGAELSAITDLLSSYRSDQANRVLTNRERLGMVGVLMQFSSYMPYLRPYAMTPFEHTEQLYQAIVSHKGAPLSFSEQLSIALEQTSGDMLEALWRLFITSRLYARWFDAPVVKDMPNFSRSKIIKRMEVFSRSVASCKSRDESLDQDTAGDVYYCWTHALAKVLFANHALRLSLTAQLEAFVLHNGTWLNHQVAHRYKAQSLPSDHTVAAHYGNAIGKLLAQTL